MNKIVIYIPSIESGGVEKNLLNIANYLVSKKVELYIITANNNKKKFFNSKIKFLCPKNSNWNNSSRFIKTLICIKIILTQLPKNNITFFSFQSNISAIILAKIHSYKIVIRLNTALDKYLSGFFKKLLFKSIYGLSNIIIVNSLSFKKNLSSTLRLKSTVILNPLDYKKKIKKKNINYFKDYKGIKLISIGRLTDQKNQITILKALKVLKLNKIKFKFFMIGQGYKLNNLKQFVKDNNLLDCVKFAGYKRNAFEFIAASDIFVLSSKFEGLPNVLIEAQSQIIPIISSDCPTGPKEIVLGGKLGTLFAVDDHLKLSKEIIKFHKNQKPYVKKAKLAKKYLYRYDYNNNLYKYLKTIRTIL